MDVIWSRFRRLVSRLHDAVNGRDERYREIVEHAPDLIFSHDLDGRFTSLNPTAERAFGFAPGAGLGRSVFDVVAPEDVETARRMIAAAVSGGSAPAVYELSALASGGGRVPLEISVRAILRDGVAAGVQAIARDLTERKRADAQLHQSEKMEAIGRLTNGIAHDFNNLLMVVRGYVDLIAARVDAGLPLNGEIDQVRKAADSAIAMTRQLVAFSRRQPLQSRVLDVNGVVAELDPMLRRLVGEDVEVATVLGARPGLIEADPALMERLVMNLAVNARDAMPQGGRLRIETAAVPAGPSTEAQVALVISDTGRGMTPETRNRLFEPFFTTKEKGRGAGLGLATVYAIVQQHRGTIEVESEIGRGTSFRIVLPAARAAAAPAPAAPVAAAAADVVLLVEDDAPVRYLVQTILTESGYRVLEAADGPSALDVFARHGHEVSLVLTDIVMPHMSGRALVERLRPLAPDLKILFMSGYTSDVIGNHGVFDSSVAFLQKPFAPDELLRRVREVLDAPAALQRA